MCGHPQDGLRQGLRGSQEQPWPLLALQPRASLPGHWGPTTAPSTDLSRRLLRPLCACSRAAPKTLPGSPREQLQPQNSSRRPARSDRSLPQTKQSQPPPPPLRSPAAGKRQRRHAGPSCHRRWSPSCPGSRSPLSPRSARAHSPAGPAGSLQRVETPAAIRGRLPAQPRAWGGLCSATHPSKRPPRPLQSLLPARSQAGRCCRESSWPRALCTGPLAAPQDPSLSGASGRCRLSLPFRTAAAGTPRWPPACPTGHPGLCSTSHAGRSPNVHHTDSLHPPAVGMQSWLSLGRAAMPQPLMAPGSPETCGKSAGSGALAAPWSSGARAPRVAFPVPEPSRARHQLCSWQGRATRYIPAEAGGAAPTGGNSSRWWPRDGQCWDKPCPTSAHTSLPLCIPGDGGLGSSVPGREQSEEGLSKQTGQVWDLC